MILPIALTAAGAAALLHIWLSIRVSHIRRTQKILHGDGGSPAMLRRMRAHGNYAENAPIFLVLLALLELAGGRPEFLWAATIVFFLSRIFHAFGMDSDKLSKLRIVGVTGSWLVLLALGAWAITLTYTQILPTTPRQEAAALRS